MRRIGDSSFLRDLGDRAEIKNWTTSLAHLSKYTSSYRYILKRKEAGYNSPKKKSHSKYVYCEGVNMGCRKVLPFHISGTKGAGNMANRNVEKYMPDHIILYEHWHLNRHPLWKPFSLLHVCRKEMCSPRALTLSRVACSPLPRFASWTVHPATTHQNICPPLTHCVISCHMEPRNIDIPPPGKHLLGLLFVPVIISDYCGSAGTSWRSLARAVCRGRTILYENRHETWNQLCAETQAGCFTCMYSRHMALCTNVLCGFSVESQATYISQPPFVC